MIDAMAAQRFIDNRGIVKPMSNNGSFAIMLKHITRLVSKKVMLCLTQIF